MKRCANKNCTWKDESCFWKNRAQHDGLTPYCKDCTKAQQKKYTQSAAGKASRRRYYQSEKGIAARRRMESSEKYRKRRAAYAKSANGKASKSRSYQHGLDRYRLKIRMPSVRFAAAQHVANRPDRKKDWNLSFAEWFNLLAGSLCFYCGGELPETSIGLDRKDNSIGYEISNVVPCCTRCNRCRGAHYTFEEFRDHIAPAIRAVDAARSSLAATSIAA